MRSLTLEPLFYSCVCPDFSEYQHDRFRAVCGPLFSSASAGAGVGRYRGWRATADLSASASEENWHAGTAACELPRCGAMRVVKQMGPAILGVSVSQISLIINTIFASFLASGSVSWMYYADRLMEFPSGVLGVALGTILLPSLSKSFSSGNHDEYCRLMDWGLRLCFLLALPSAVALGILAKPLTVSLFQYGKFTAFDAAMTQRALVAYSVGLIGLIVVKVLAPGFYSRRDIKRQ